MILNQIAQEVAEKTSRILDHPISITDKDGYIIGCTDARRLGTFHKPSLEVIRQNRLLHCELEESKRLENVLPGISVPIMFNNKAIGVLGIVGDPTEVEKYVQLVKSNVEMMCQEAFRKEMDNLESKMIELFTQSLIHSNPENEAHVKLYAKTLDYDLELPRACILIQLEPLLSTSEEQEPSRPSQEYFSNLFGFELSEYLSLIFRDSKEDIISLINVNEFIILKMIKDAEVEKQFLDSLPHKLAKLNHFLKSKYDLSARIAVGQPGCGTAGLSASYRNALKAATAGKKCRKESTIYHWNDWFITLELLPQELSPDLIEKLSKSIQRLLAYDNYPSLADAFLTYCRNNMNLSEAARILFIHRNTLIYRLEKIHELTSLNPYQFEHCILLYTAIKYHQANIYA